MSKRKYPEVKGYWVYSIKVPSIGKYYIGVSKMTCSQRWHKKAYKDSSLNQYLDEWGLMEKNVLIDSLTKEQAYLYEGNIIQALKINNLCINELRSGLITNDINAYNRQRYKNDAEFRERQKQYYEDNREKYNAYHREKRKNNTEFREREKQYRENNKEKIKEYQKQYREKNKEKAREYQKQYRLKKKLEKQQINN